MSKIVTPTDYVLRTVGRYPSLFSATSYDNARKRVLDQLFNVIGNGIRDDDELRDELRPAQFDRTRAERFCNGACSVYGYFAVKKYGSGEHKFEVGEGKSITVGDWEMNDHPEVVFWMPKNQHIDFRPYPNFKKDYSIVWDAGFIDAVTDEWLEEAIWFYTICREWMAENESKYHEVYPASTQAETDKILSGMEAARSRYQSDEEFSKAYGHHYDGDMSDFLTRRWAAKKQEIIDFIDETIKMLEDAIEGKKKNV